MQVTKKIQKQKKQNQTPLITQKDQDDFEDEQSKLTHLILNKMDSKELIKNNNIMKLSGHTYQYSPYQDYIQNNNKYTEYMEIEDQEPEKNVNYNLKQINTEDNLNNEEIKQVFLDFACINCQRYENVEAIRQNIELVQCFPNVEFLHMDFSNIENSSLLVKKEEDYTYVLQKIIDAIHNLKNLKKLKNLSLNLKIFYQIGRGLRSINVINSMLNTIKEMQLSTLIIYANKEQNIDPDLFRSVIASQKDYLIHLDLYFSTEDKQFLFYRIVEVLQELDKLENFTYYSYGLFFDSLTNRYMYKLSDSITHLKNLKTINLQLQTIQYEEELVNPDFIYLAKALGTHPSLKSIIFNVGQNRSQDGSVNKSFFRLDKKQFAYQISKQLKRNNLKFISFNGFPDYLTEFGESFTENMFKRNFYLLLAKKFKSTQAFRAEKVSEAIELLIQATDRKRGVFICPQSVKLI